MPGCARLSGSAHPELPGQESLFPGRSRTPALPLPTREHIDHMQIERTGERGFKKLLERGQTAPTEAFVQQLCQGALRIYSCWLLSSLPHRKGSFNHPTKCTGSSGDKTLGLSSHSAVSQLSKAGLF